MAGLPRMLGGRAVLLVVLGLLLAPLLAESTGAVTDAAAAKAARREQLYHKVRAQVEKIMQEAIRKKRSVVASFTTSGGTTSAFGRDTLGGGYQQAGVGRDQGRLVFGQVAIGYCSAVPVEYFELFQTLIRVFMDGSFMVGRRIRVGFKICSPREAQPEIKRRITEAVDSGSFGGFTTEPGSTRFGYVCYVFSENVGKEWRRRTSLARFRTVCTPRLAVSGCVHRNLEYYAAYRLTMRFHDELRNETSMRYTAVKDDIFVNASSELALVRGLAKVDLDEFRPGFFSTFAILKISAPHYAVTRTREKYNSFVSSGLIGPRLLDPNYTYFSSARPPRFEAIADLAFLLDHSAGVTQYFGRILNFTSRLVNHLEVGPGAVRVTVFTVSSQVRQHFALDSFTTAESVTEAISNIQNMAPLPNSSRPIGRALRDMMRYGFGERDGSRPDVYKAAVILTNGDSDDEVSRPALEAVMGGVSIYAVGVSSQLVNMTRAADQAFPLANLTYLDDRLAKNLAGTIAAGGVATYVKVELPDWPYTAAMRDPLSSDFQTISLYLETPTLNLFSNFNGFQYTYAVDYQPLNSSSGSGTLAVCRFDLAHYTDYDLFKSTMENAGFMATYEGPTWNQNITWASVASGFGDPSLSLDGDLSTYWYPEGPALGDTYMVFDLQAVYTLSAFSVVATGNGTNDPISFNLQISASPWPYNWQDVRSFTAIQGTDRQQIFAGFIATSRYWRLYITETGGGGKPAISDIQFFGQQAVTTRYTSLELPLPAGYWPQGFSRDSYQAVRVAQEVENGVVELMRNDGLFVHVIQALWIRPGVNSLIVQLRLMIAYSAMPAVRDTLAAAITEGELLEPAVYPQFSGFSIAAPVSPAPVDLAFVIDGSSTMGEDGFSQTKLLLTRIVQELDIGTTGTRVTVVQYGNQGWQEFGLDSYTSSRTLQRAINNIEFLNGGSNLADGLNVLYKFGFIRRNGGRPGILKTALVIAGEGAANDTAGAVRAAAQLHLSGLTVMAIGVGPGTAGLSLQISSDPQFAYSVQSASELFLFRNVLEGILWQAGVNERLYGSFKPRPGIPFNNLTATAYLHPESAEYASVLEKEAVYQGQVCLPVCGWCSVPRTGVFTCVWMVFSTKESTKDRCVYLCVDGVQYQGQVCLHVCGWCSAPRTGVFTCVWMVFSTKDRCVYMCVDGVQYQGQVHAKLLPLAAGNLVVHTIGFGAKLGELRINFQVDLSASVNITAVQYALMDLSGLELVGFQYPVWLTNTSGWTISASHNINDTLLTVDQDPTTVWSPGDDTVNETWHLTYDLQNVHTLTRLELVSSGGGTRVKLFKLQVSRGVAPGGVWRWRDVKTFAARQGVDAVQFSGFRARGRYWRILIMSTYGGLSPVIAVDTAYLTVETMDTFMPSMNNVGSEEFVNFKLIPEWAATFVAEDIARVYSMVVYDIRNSYGNTAILMQILAETTAIPALQASMEEFYHFNDTFNIAIFNPAVFTMFPGFQITPD
ncbi:Cartilage matrix protein, partial [Branchiostoma belcheri]